MPILPSGGSRHVEDGDSAPQLSEMYLVRDGTGAWIYSDTGPAEAQLVLTDALGGYEIITFVECVIVFDGTDYVVQPSGTPAAIIIFDGTDYIVTNDLTQTPAASIRVAALGDYVVVPFTSAILRARRIAGSNIIIY